MDYDPAGDEPGILAGMDHLGQPVERGIGIAPAHRLDEGADGVVVGVAVAVVNHGLALDAFLGHGSVDANDPITARRRGHGGDLDRIESLAGVPIGNPGQMSQSLRFGRDTEVSQTALGIAQRPPEQLQQVCLVQWLQLEDLGSGHQRGIDEEERVVGSRSDELHRAAFHVGQQHILLSAVESVDLVNEEQGRFARVAQPVISPLQNPSHLGQIGFHSVEFLEAGFRASGNDLGQGGFTSSGRPEEDEGLNAVGIDGAAEQEARCQQVPLAGVFLQGVRSHP